MAASNSIDPRDHYSLGPSKTKTDKIPIKEKEKYSNPLLTNILGKIGFGAYGQVYETCQNNEISALKISFFHDQEDLLTGKLLRGGLEGLIRESTLSSLLKSSNFINPIDQVIFVNGINDISNLSPKLDGDLMTLIRKRNSEEKVEPAVPDPIKLAFDLLSGMKDIHDSGFIHNDLKPANILYYTNDNESICYRITDFGISFIYGMGNGRNDTTAVYKSPSYYETGKANVITDLWAIGKILYISIFQGSNITFFKGMNSRTTNERVAKRLRRSIDSKLFDIRNLNDDKLNDLVELMLEMLQEEYHNADYYLNNSIFDDYRDTSCVIPTITCVTPEKYLENINAEIVDIIEYSPYPEYNFDELSEIYEILDLDIIDKIILKINSHLGINSLTLGREKMSINNNNVKQLLTRYINNINDKFEVNTGFLTVATIVSYHIYSSLIEPMYKPQFPDFYISTFRMKNTKASYLTFKTVMIDFFKSLNSNFIV